MVVVEVLVMATEVLEEEYLLAACVIAQHRTSIHPLLNVFAHALEPLSVERIEDGPQFGGVPGDQSVPIHIDDGAQEEFACVCAHGVVFGIHANALGYQSALCHFDPPLLSVV